MYFWFCISRCPAPSIGGAYEFKRADCLSPAIAKAKAGRVSACSGRFNRLMPQASCRQARRQAKRGAQSRRRRDEHPNEPGNAAWWREALRHRPIGRRAGLSGARAFSFSFLFFHEKEKEESIDEKHPGSVEPLPIFRQRWGHRPELRTMKLPSPDSAMENIHPTDTTRPIPTAASLRGLPNRPPWPA